MPGRLRVTNLRDRFQSLVVSPAKRLVVADLDPADTLGWSEGDARQYLKALQDRLGKLQSLFYADSRYALLIVLQGMDTSGKDGTIRIVLEGISPLGVQVTAFKTPVGQELKHDFLWRIHQAVPGRGSIGIFNRSHYEDFLYPTVFGGLKTNQLDQRLTAINAFEDMLFNDRVVTLKFFLHISKAEQKERLKARLTDPTKQWKFATEDLASRKNWRRFMAAYEAMINRTSSKQSPWIVVPSDHKWFRNVVVAEAVVRHLEGLKLKFPRNGLDLKSIKIK